MPFLKMPGIFDGQTDVGKINSHVEAPFIDASSDEYSTFRLGNKHLVYHDDFHFVWKKMKGDFIFMRGESLLEKVLKSIENLVDDSPKS